MSTLADAQVAADSVTATYRATVGHFAGTLDAMPAAPISLPSTIDVARGLATEVSDRSPAPADGRCRCSMR